MYLGWTRISFSRQLSLQYRWKFVLLSNNALTTGTKDFFKIVAFLPLASAASINCWSISSWTLSSVSSSSTFSLGCDRKFSRLSRSLSSPYCFGSSVFAVPFFTLSFSSSISFFASSGFISISYETLTEPKLKWYFCIFFRLWGSELQAQTRILKYNYKPGDNALKISPTIPGILNVKEASSDTFRSAQMFCAASEFTSLK